MIGIRRGKRLEEAGTFSAICPAARFWSRRVMAEKFSWVGEEAVKMGEVKPGAGTYQVQV